MSLAMAGFLRKKSKNQPGPPPPPTNNLPNSAPTPIFAKFASCSGQKSRHAAARSPSQTRIVVSQPMLLGSANPQRVTSSSHTSGKELDDWRLRDPHATPRTGAMLSHVESRNSAYRQQPGTQAGISAHNRQIQKTRGRVQALEDKPLPIPVPDDDDPPLVNDVNVGTSSHIGLARSFVAQPTTSSHYVSRSQSDIPPPTTHDDRAQVTPRGWGALGDVPRPVEEHSVIDQRSIFPQDFDLSVHQPWEPSHHPTLQPHNMQSRSRSHVKRGSGTPTTARGLVTQSLVHEHTVRMPQQTENPQTYTRHVNGGVPLRVADAVNGPTASAYTLRNDAQRLEPKLGMSGDVVSQAGQTNPYQSADSIAINANDLGSTLNIIRHNTRSDRPLPSQPEPAGQVGRNGDIYVDVPVEPTQRVPTLSAGEVPPEFALYRVS